MKKFMTFLVFVVAISASLGLYRIKYEVRDLERRAAELSERIDRDRAAVRVLSAEYSYLVRPQRLETLNDRFLKLAPPTAAQIMTAAELPARPEKKLTAAAETLPETGLSTKQGGKP